MGRHGRSVDDAAPAAEPRAARRATRTRVSERFRQERPQHVRHILSIALAHAISWFARALPAPLRYWLADRLGDLIFALSTGYRENVRRNLTQALGYMGRPGPTDETVRRVYRTSARNWADLLVSPGKSSAELNREVEVVRGSWEILDRALAEGHGLILVTAHLGAFDYIGHAVHGRGYPITAVTGRTTSRFVFDGVTFLRRAHGMKLAEATPSGVRRTIQAVRRGECAVLVNDRDFFQNGLPVELFGRETTLPPGAVRIARETGAPIVPIFTTRAERGHRLLIFDAIHVARTSDIDRDLTEGLREVAAAIEAAIATAPDQWVMFQEAWPSAPADPVRAVPVGSPLSAEFAERVRVGATLPRRRPH
jgi:KDO2-lipid IV(A) lauroyltransferase